MSRWRPLPEPGDSDPRPVSESLDGMARRLGGAKASVLNVVFARWEEIVGPSVAAHAEPLSLRDGVLTLGTDQPGWATQLRFLAPDLLRRVAAVAGEGAVDRVEVRVRPPGPG
jgi:predicted nucleic acid-binding Zn ribbon protein